MAPRELTLNVVMMTKREYDALVAAAAANPWAAVEAAPPVDQQWRLVGAGARGLTVVAVKPRQVGQVQMLKNVGNCDVRVGDVWFSPAAQKKMGEQEATP